MSNPAAPDLTAPASKLVLPDIDPNMGLMFGAADHLVPLFAQGSINGRNARLMALRAIEAYEPETRADWVNIARTIAFSMAALALLGLAAGKDVTMPEKLRAFGRANALSQSADLSERTMMQRRSYRQANPRVEYPASTAPAPEPDPEFDNAAMEAAIAEAIQIAINPGRQSSTAAEPRESAPASSQAASAPPTSAPPTSAPPASAQFAHAQSAHAQFAHAQSAHAQSAHAQSASGVSAHGVSAPAPGAPTMPRPVPSLAQPPMATPAATPRFNPPGRGTGPVRTAPYRDALLRDTAMPRMAGQGGPA
jgi:hypothetical protein